MRQFTFALLFSCLAAPAFAYTTTVNQLVDSHDNLFYSDWGHWFTQPGDRGLAEPGSQAAQAVSWGGAGFNFADFSTISIAASGVAAEDGIAEFNPDGVCVSRCETVAFPSSDFRVSGLTAYSLIGIWSKSATAIDPFYSGDYGWRDIDSGLGLLLIGSQRDLVVPDFSSAYLFLAVNDGGFADNVGAFDVRITANVPEPSPLALLAAGLLGIVLMRRKRST